MPASWSLLTQYQSVLIWHTYRNRYNPREKKEAPARQEMYKGKTVRLTDDLISVSLISFWRSCPVSLCTRSVPVSITQYYLKDLPQKDSFHHTWLQRLSPPSLWSFGLAMLAFSAILASGIIIAVLTPKALMLSCHLDLGKKKIRVERRARYVQEVNGERCEKMLERIGELSQISNISWKVWNVFGGFFGRWEEGFVLMNMHKYTAEKYYLFSSPTGQILAFEWLISWKSWITLQSINYGQADNIEKQQS